MIRRGLLACAALAGCAAATEPPPVVPVAPAPAMKPIMQYVYPVPEDHGPQRVEVLTRDVPAGATIPWHTHAGVEIVYVENGRMEALVAGQKPVPITAGGYFVFDRGLVHSGRNTGTGPARLVITYVLDKDAPQRTPAPAPPGY